MPTRNAIGSAIATDANNSDASSAKFKGRIAGNGHLPAFDSSPHKARGEELNLGHKLHPGNGF
jgi:hypothetical protein